MIIHKYTLAPLDEEDPQPIIEWKAGEEYDVLLRPCAGGCGTKIMLRFYPNRVATCTDDPVDPASPVFCWDCFEKQVPREEKWDPVCKRASRCGNECPLTCEGGSLWLPHCFENAEVGK